MFQGPPRPHVSGSIIIIIIIIIDYVWLRGGGPQEGGALDLAPGATASIPVQVRPPRSLRALDLTSIHLTAQRSQQGNFLQSA